MVNDTHTRRRRRLDQHVQAGLGMLNEVRIFELRLKYLDSNSFFAPFIFDSEFFFGGRKHTPSNHVVSAINIKASIRRFRPDCVVNAGPRLAHAVTDQAQRAG